MISTLTPWIAIDLDGTIANCDHRLKYIIDMSTGKKLPSKLRDYDKFYSNCIEDIPIRETMAFIHSQYGDTRYFFITGRPEQMRLETLEWLKLWKGLMGLEIVRPSRLLMRRTDDMNEDRIVKTNLMKAAIELNGNMLPSAAFEDRQPVIDAWRGLGVPVYNSKLIPELWNAMIKAKQ